jgi:hypothetical protein
VCDFCFLLVSTVFVECFCECVKGLGLLCGRLFRLVIGCFDGLICVVRCLFMGECLRIVFMNLCLFIVV